MEDIPDIHTFKLRYIGARFEGARMPLDVLPDLPAFRDLLVAFVKAKWRAANPERKRLPKNFMRGLQFDLKKIEEGSAVPALEWNVESAQAELPEFQPEIERLVVDAFEQVTAFVAGAGSTASADRLTRDELRALNRFGADLQDGERIEFVGRTDAEGNVVSLDRYRRKQLLTRTTNVYQTQLDGVGVLVGAYAKDDTGWIAVKTTSYGEITIPLPSDRVKAEFDGAIDGEVQFRIVAELDRDDRLQAIKGVLEVELVNANVNEALERCRGRIAELSYLGEGWHDGFGDAPSHRALTGALTFLEQNARLADQFRIYPTDEGGILIEFRLDGWSYSVDIASDGLADFYGVQIDGPRDIQFEALTVDSVEFQTQFNKAVGE